MLQSLEIATSKGRVDNAVDVRRCARLGIFLIVFAAAITTAAAAEASTYYVSPLGNDANSCTSAQSTTQSNQKLTISAGVACLSAGDTLYIHGGTFTGPLNVVDSQLYPVRSGTDFSAGAITISAYPGETVTVRPPDNVACVRYATTQVAYVIVADLICDMQNSRTSGGSTESGINVSYGSHHNRFLRIEVKNNSGNGIGIGHNGGAAHHNEVINSRIHDNGTFEVNSGYGLYISAPDNVIEGNSVYNNTGYGIHIYGLDGQTKYSHRNVVGHNRIFNNGTSGGTNYGIVVAQGQDNVVYDNLIYGNRGGIQVYTGSSNTGVYNNTVYGNVSEGVSLQYYGTGTIVRNNIVFANGSNISDYGNAATIDRNLTTDPVFVNEAAGDFRLQEWSVAKDAGAPISVVRDDYSGTPRPSGAAYDIGAFEFSTSISTQSTGNTPPPSPPPPVQTQVQTPPTVTIVSPTNNAGFEGSGYFSGRAADERDGDISAKLTWTSSIDGAIGTGASFNKVLSRGNHVITASVTDSSGLAASMQVSVAITSSNTVPVVSITSPTAASYAAGTVLSFAGSASDTQDGNITTRLTWTSSIDGPLASGGSFTRALSAGTHIITASVIDSGGLSGSKQITVNMTAPNTAPVVSIANQTSSSYTYGTSVSFVGSATDSQDGNLTARLTWTSNIDGVLAAGGSFSKVLSPGTHAITAAVTDSGGLVGSKQITVSVTAANTAPTVSITSPTSVAFAAGTGISFAGTAIDTQDGNLTTRLAWTSSIDGVLGTGGGFTKVLSAGTHVITASVTDSSGFAASKQMTLSVTAANTAPVVLITSPTSASYVAGTSLSFVGAATDHEDGNLTSRLVWISSLSGQIGFGGTFTAALAQGTHLITASATDSGGITSISQLSITVGPSVTPTTTLPTMAATPYKIKGIPYVDLTWSGFSGAAVDVYRNGSRITTVRNNGFWTDGLNRHAAGSFTYKLCVSGTNACSDTVAVTF